MPKAGGEADKVGNRYELLWITRVLLDVLRQTYNWLDVEPLGDEVDGFELVALNKDGNKEFHCLKRQTSKREWTISLLNNSKSNGRSILSDLLSKLSEDTTHRCSFVSATGANALRELEERAKQYDRHEDFESSIRQNERLSGDFDTIVKLCSGNSKLAYDCLRRLTVVLLDERELSRSVDIVIAFLICLPSQQPEHAAHVRGLLGQLVLANLSNKIDTPKIQEFLSGHGYSVEGNTSNQSAVLNASTSASKFVSAAELNRSQMPRIDRPEVVPIVEYLTSTDAKKTIFVSGGPGIGKTQVLASVVEKLTAFQSPTMVVQLDRYSTANSSYELGQQMQLDASPAVVLAKAAVGANSFLVIDQLDSVSTLSGRNEPVWHALEDLFYEVRQHPRMKVLLACRTFDLENEPRLRILNDPKSSHVITLKELDRNTVLEVLSATTSAKYIVTDSQIQILQNPLHLQLYLTSRNATEFKTIGDLWDCYWENKRQRVSLLVKPSEWDEVISQLVADMSSKQRLYAIKIAFDDHIATVNAMAMEGVLVLDSGYLKFFHESLFDYAFARLFVKRGQSLIYFLSKNEQSLFCRSQVRQVLAFLRDKDPEEYRRQLKEVLNSKAVRFHIKRLTVLWLGSILNPTEEEWGILKEVLPDAELQSHIWISIRNALPWFDLLDRLGVIQQWIDSSEENDTNRAIWFLINSDVQKLRSERAADLLLPRYRTSDKWKKYCLTYVDFAADYPSRPIQHFFLCLLVDGLFESELCDERVNWLTRLRGSVEASPDFAIEALSCWLDNRVLLNPNDAQDQQRLNAGGRHTESVELLKRLAELRADLFVETILPRLVRSVVRNPYPRSYKNTADSIWYFRSNSPPSTFSDGLLAALLVAMKSLAVTDPNRLRVAISNLLNTKRDTIAVLLLRSFTSNPNKFANECFAFISADPERLNIGYGLCSGGEPGGAISREAIQQCWPHANQRLRDQLESRILGCLLGPNPDDWDLRHQLRLLKCIPKSDLSRRGHEQLRLLQKMYPRINCGIPPETSDSDLLIKCESPVAAAKARLLTDDQWLSVMKRYDYGSDDKREEPPGRFLRGSALELSRVLRSVSAASPDRFAKLCVKMNSSLHHLYFSAILEGLCDSAGDETGRKRIEKDTKGEQIHDLILDAIHRLHSIPDRPCGRAICDSFEILIAERLTTRDLEVLGYYATEDPDPSSENWSKSTSSIEEQAEQPFIEGINSVRGGAATVIQGLLIAAPNHLPFFRPILRQLANDRFISVRVCAIRALFPVYWHDRDFAIERFTELCRFEPRVIASKPFERFAKYASQTHYDKLRPIFIAGVESSFKPAQSAAAIQITLASFVVDEAKRDLDHLLNGNENVRTAIAHVYAVNVGDPTVGDTCKASLRTFFVDPSDAVRAKAANCFYYLKSVSQSADIDLISAYLESPAASTASFNSVIKLLTTSKLQLPELTIKLAEVVIEVEKIKQGNNRSFGSLESEQTASLVIRLYSQSASQTTRERCLDLIDDMEKHHFYGVTGLLEKIDR